jgi:hypothetical protein
VRRHIEDDEGCLVVSCLLAASTPAVFAADQEKLGDTGFSLRGRVVEGANGRPIRNARGSEPPNARGSQVVALYAGEIAFVHPIIKHVTS